MYYRIFAPTEALPDPAALAATLAALHPPVRIHVRGDDGGWFAIELHLPGPGAAPLLERFHVDEDELRGDLNSWAAWLETQDHAGGHEKLMEHVALTRQLFLLRKPMDHRDDAALERTCEAACRTLAGLTDGVWQADGRGFFGPDGEELLAED